MDDKGADGNELTLNVPGFGPVVARGALVILVLLAIGLGAFIWALNKEREAEHDQIVNAINYNSCLNRLALYFSVYPGGSDIQFRKMPLDLWKCLPSYIAEKESK